MWGSCDYFLWLPLCFLMFTFLKVTKEEGLALAREFSCPFFETSAAYRYYIDDVFHALVREIRRKEKEAVLAMEKKSKPKTSVWKRLKSPFRKKKDSVTWREGVWVHLWTAGLTQSHPVTCSSEHCACSFSCDDCSFKCNWWRGYTQGAFSMTCCLEYCPLANSDLLTQLSTVYL